MAKAGSTEKVVREIRRAHTRASQTNAVEGVLTGALGRPGRLRLFTVAVLTLAGLKGVGARCDQARLVKGE